MSKARVMDGRIYFWCPGCSERHMIDPSIWGWNGNVDAPTFTPSVLISSGHYISTHKGKCWCDYNREHPDEKDVFICRRCHSFVRDGRIEFLSDSTHALAGQTVDLPEMP